MVLDSGDEVYVWVGRGSDDEEKEKALTMAEVCASSQDQVKLLITLLKRWIVIYLCENICIEKIIEKLVE